jgi:hypothetical protein
MTKDKDEATKFASKVAIWGIAISVVGFLIWGACKLIGIVYAPASAWLPF